MSFGAEILFARGGQADILFADPVFHRPSLEKRYFNGQEDKLFWQAEIDALCELWRAGVRVPELLAHDSSDCSTVMQRIDGNTLETLLSMGWLRNAAFANHILSSLCEQIKKMHAVGWLHLDLSPENVLVDAKGDVWLLDFALAQHVSDIRPLTFGKKKYIPKQYWELPREDNDWHAVGIMLDEMREAMCRNRNK